MKILSRLADRPRDVRHSHMKDVLVPFREYLKYLSEADDEEKQAINMDNLTWWGIDYLRKYLYIVAASELEELLADEQGNIDQRAQSGSEDVQDCEDRAGGPETSGADGDQLGGLVGTSSDESKPIGGTDETSDISADDQVPLHLMRDVLLYLQSLLDPELFKGLSTFMLDGSYYDISFVMILALPVINGRPQELPQLESRYVALTVVGLASY